MKKNIRNNKKIFIIIGSVIFSILVVVLLLSLLITPNLTLKGSKNIELEFSSQYKELGYEASLFGKDYTSKVKLIDNINYDELGNYYIEYIIENKLGTNKRILKRNVKIVDTVYPVITLMGSDVLLDLNQQYIELGYSAIDNYDGDITSKVEIQSNLDTTKEGKYKVLYTASDSSGNKTVVERNIIVQSKNVKSVPILTYHHFMTATEKNIYASNDKYTMSIESFEQQLKYLKENGYNTITLDDFYKWYKGEISLTKKDVVIVIDDGNISAYEYAIPLIEKYGFKATIFVITGRISSDEKKWDPAKNQFFNEKIIKDIQENHKNIELQSHTHNLHQKIEDKIAISVKTKEEVEIDFKISKEILNAEYLAFPYGGNTISTEELLKKIGYKMAFGFGTTGYGLATKSDSQYYIKRVNINAEVSLDAFINWLEVR